MSSGKCLFLSISQLCFLCNGLSPQQVGTTWKEGPWQSRLLRANEAWRVVFLFVCLFSGAPSWVNCFKILGFVLISTLRPRAFFWISCPVMCTVFPTPHTHRHTHTHSQFYHCSTQGLLWRFHKVRISICLSFFLIHSPALYSSQSKSDFETGHQLFLLKSAPFSAWPIAVLGGTEYSDEPRVCPSLWELEHSLMDSPTNYVCDWSEERGLQK